MRHTCKCERFFINTKLQAFSFNVTETNLLIMKKFFIPSVLCIFLISCTKSNKQNPFSFDSDIRVFTAFALLNQSGFDHDWLKMDTMRIVVRKYVDSTLHEDFKKEIKEFTNRTNLDWYSCAAYALNLDGAPSFKWICDSCNTDLKSKFKGLDVLYRKFYNNANIQSIWDQNKRTLDSINYSYKPYSEKALLDITSFLRIDNNYYSFYTDKIHFLICPLMSHWTGFNHTVGKTLYLVYGPSSGPAGPDIFYHEALHIPIGQIVKKYTSDENKLDTLYKLSQEQLKGNYNSLEAVINESLVRTVDKYLAGISYKQDEENVRDNIINEYKLGFIFCPFIFENIPNYIKSNKTFEEYYPVLMANLDVNKEIARWKNFQKSSKK
jgi:hypothetical protein